MSQQTGRRRPPSQGRPGVPVTRHGRSPEVYARRRLVALVLLVAVVTGIFLLLAFVWPGFAAGSGEKAPAEDRKSTRLNSSHWE